jgi:exopolysaccharide biosynthesis polyprenyl glycosylphosphotransferase
MVAKRAEPVQAPPRAEGLLHAATAQLDPVPASGSASAALLEVADADPGGARDAIAFDIRSPGGAATSRPRSWNAPRFAIFGSDVVAIGLALGLATVIASHASAASAGARFGADVALMAPMPVIVLSAFALNGLYRRWSYQVLSSSFTELRAIVFSLGLAGSVTLGIDHLWAGLDRTASVDSVTVVVAFLLTVATVTAIRALTRVALRASRLGRCRTIVLGSGMMADQLIQRLIADRRVELVGAVDDDPRPGTQVLGSSGDLLRIVEERRIDQVLVGFSRTHPLRLTEILQRLPEHVAVAVVPRYFELLSWRCTVDEIGGVPVIDVAPPSLSLTARVAKRVFDLMVALLLSLVTSPVLVCAAIAIKVTSPGPVMFRQTRVGRGRRSFQIWKLRTMTVGAEEARSSLELANEVDGPLFKLTEDPRVTRVGAFLRKTSLDELPQLFNVILGQMSLVGPRPFVPGEAAHITGAAGRRFEVRPGITGLWQVSGRSDLAYDELRRLDYLYVASWSLWWDMRILWHTPTAVIRGRGAY